ncbi:MAG: Altered inheritance of mitochondria protein 18 mitochondrial [Watsoniomyces obsoletus]|nr:MAG: Altered inheritance of mitochondria protein 18 mitochondrial [Watsoniomyces obsoletus]
MDIRLLLPRHRLHQYLTPRRSTPRCFLRNHPRRRHGSTTTTTTPTTRSSSTKQQDFEQMPRNPLDPITIHRIEAARRAHYTRGMYRSAAGMLTCIGITGLIVMTVDIEKMKEKNDSLGNDPLNTVPVTTPVVIKGVGSQSPIPDLVEKDSGVIETGTSTIPTFPKTILLEKDSSSKTASSATTTLPAGSKQSTEYVLLGLGIRTVSFLGIQVYVAGIYVARDDISKLQSLLMHEINPIATTLVADEKEKLKGILLDVERGEEIWNGILKRTTTDGGGIRSVLRIVPTRNTDWLHLRDGWMRAITTRTTEASMRSNTTTKKKAKDGMIVNTNKKEVEGNDKEEDNFQDESFGISIQQFKDLFKNAPRSKNPKGDPILLVRNEKGGMDILTSSTGGSGEVGSGGKNPDAESKEVKKGDENNKDKGMIKIGRIQDERISRLLWLQYLAGKKVASESLRTNVVEGVVELMGRPVGTALVSSSITTS